MVVQQIDQLLKELGWTDGFRIPVANEENKALEDEVEGKTKTKAKLITEVEEINDRVDNLTKHKQNVTTEHQQNQGLITAHMSEIQAEENMYHLAKRECDRLTQEISQLEKNFRDTQETQKRLQTDIFRVTEKLELHKSKIRWNKEAIDEWEKGMSPEVDDVEMLLEYMREDEIKTNDTALELEKLQLVLSEKKKEFDKTLNEVIGLEQELEKTAEMFRMHHVERQNLLQRWEAAVRMLQTRDNDIHRVLKDIAALKKLYRQKQEELDDQKRFYQNEVNNNLEVQRKIDANDRLVAKLRGEYQIAVQELEQLKSNVASLKSILSNVGMKLDHQRSRNKQMVEELKKLKNKCEEMMKTNAALKVKFEEIANVTLTAAEKAKRMEEMVENEEKCIDIRSEDSSRLSELLFRKNFELKMLKNDEVLLTSEIKGCKSSKRRINHSASMIERENRAQKELMYNLEVKIQSLEARMTMVAGEQAKDEQGELERMITDLESTLSKKTSTRNMLSQQVKKLQEDIRRLRLALLNDASEEKDLRDKVHNISIVCEGGEKDLKLTIDRKQEKLVEENLLRLRLTQAKKTIEKVGGKLYSLEKQRLELEAAMKERSVEIESHKEIFETQKRVLCEQRAQVKADIQGRESRIEKLKNRYEIVVKSIGKGDDGEELSVTEIKIKAAQEKYALQEKGDSLDAQIKKAEKEIQALENTLRLINTTNDTYKRNLAVVDEHSPEFEEKKSLESQYGVTLDKLRLRKSQVKELEQDLEVMEGTLHELNTAKQEVQNAWKERELEAMNLNQQVKEQQAKLSRADNLVKRHARELRRSDSAPLTFEEQDFELRDLRERNRLALKQLGDLVEKNAEAMPVVTCYLEEKNLEPPRLHPGSGSCIRLSASSRGSNVSTPKSPASLSPGGSLRTGSQSSVRSPAVVTLDASQFEGEFSGSAQRRSSGGSFKEKRKSIDEG